MLNQLITSCEKMTRVVVHVKLYTYAYNEYIPKYIYGKVSWCYAQPTNTFLLENGKSNYALVSIYAYMHAYVQYL